MAKNFKDLLVWQKSFDLALEIYKNTKAFPNSEIYSLTQQIKRASISIPSNISEGFRRYHNKEYKQFLFIALGSCAELETQLRLAKKLEYLKGSELSLFLEYLDHICRMLRNLIKKL